MAIRLGIDFGTTRTVVAGQEIGNYPVCTFSWQGETKEYIPTLVGVKDGILHFGWDAACLLNHPDAFILHSVKRLTGRFRPEDPVDLGPDFSMTLLDAVTLFLDHVRQMVTEHGNISLKKKDALEVMVATPTNAGSNQRYITLEGFRKAGFNVLGAMDEPSAVAVEFLYRHLRDLKPRSPKRYVAVYDLGGGAFDASVVGIADPNHDVLAHERIAGLGGDDFDEIILDLALEQAGLTQGVLTPNDRARLLEECRERKEGLKPNTRKMVIDLATVLRDQKPVILDTGLVYERCGRVIETSLKSLRSVLGRIHQNTEQSQSLAGVYLAGGSVLFPPVGRKLRETYAGKVKVSPLPHASTAIGLSIAGDPKAKVEARESVYRNFGSWQERDEDRQADLGAGLLGGAGTNQPAADIGLLRYFQYSSPGKGKEPEGSISLRQDAFEPYDLNLKEPARFHSDPVEARPVGIEVEIRKTGRIRKKRIHWHCSASAEVSNYRLYWSVGEAVGYGSQYVELDNVTEAILPDDIPSFPLVSGTVHLGITALSNEGNESDMTKISTSLDLLAPEAPQRIWLEE
jgi:actin-like ATPase involved in cell morphogenesis